MVTRAKFERNEITRDQFVSTFEDEAGALGFRVSAARFEMSRNYNPPNMVDAIKSLRKEYKLAVLTNNLLQSSSDSDTAKKAPQPI